MKNLSPINRHKILILPILLSAVLLTATAARSQTTQASSTIDTANNSQTTAAADEECLRRLDKTLDALEKSQLAKTDVDAELLTNKNLLVKESEYNSELLKAVALLTSSEKRNRSFFEKLGIQLGKVLKAATDPKALATIVSLIILVRQIQK